MNIALMSHDRKKELMVQFCLAYAGILSKHTLCATSATGGVVMEGTGLKVHQFLPGARGGLQQIGARIAYNEVDLVILFADPQVSSEDADYHYIIQLCEQYNVPCAINLATAECLILGLDRGDLDWRDIVNPKNKPFVV